MKKDIHPKLYMDTKVTCACGNTFVTISTLPEITVEICSNCHPYFTGTQKFIDTEGRIQKFQKRMATAQKASELPRGSRQRAKKAKAGAKDEDPRKSKSLKDMLATARNDGE